MKTWGECVGGGEDGYARDDGMRWRVEGGQSTLHYWSRLFHRGRRGAAAVAAVRDEDERCEKREEEEKEGGS